MSKIINATPDENGRIIVEFYGEKTEIDDSMFNEKGVATIKKFGEEYEIHRPATKKTDTDDEKTSKKAKK